MGEEDSTDNSTTNDQQVKMLVQHIQQLSRRITQMEAASREVTRKAQTVDIVMGQMQSQLSALSTDEDSVADISIVSEASPVPKQKGRKKKGKNVRLEVSEN
jgi:predicted neutral ceramidase superfamily lipid hydrolase